MLIIAGSRMYGRVDAVPSLFHVETRFIHLWFVPLIPLASYLIFDHAGRKVAVTGLGLSFKSWMAAWLRGFMLIHAVLFGCWTAVEILNPVQRGSYLPALTLALLTVAMTSLWWWLSFGHYWRRASYARAVRLSEKAKLGPTVDALIDLHFGTITEDEAKEIIELERLAQQEADQRAEQTAESSAFEGTPRTAAT